MAELVAIGIDSWAETEHQKDINVLDPNYCLSDPLNMATMATNGSP